MSIGFDHFCWIVLFETPHVIELSVLTGIGGCGCPISSRVFRWTALSLQFTKRAPASASEAVNITFLSKWEIVIIAPLSMGRLVDGLFPRVKCPPTRIHVFGSDR